MAGCPVYSGPICSLCCSLDARCGDGCKPHGRFYEQISAVVQATLPKQIADNLNSGVGRFIGVFLLSAGTIAAVLALVYFQATVNAADQKAMIGHTLWVVFFILLIISGIASWLFVLAHESRRVAEEESDGQTRLLLREIEAHDETDAQLQKARDVAEAANQAKSRYVIGIGHELRTPLNAILGYAQLMERDEQMPPHRRGGVRVIRRSAEHLSGLIDGLLDISRIESGRLQLRPRRGAPAGIPRSDRRNVPASGARRRACEFRFKRPEHLPRRRLDRREAAAPDPDQPAVQRHQVHARGPDRAPAEDAERRRRIRDRRYRSRAFPKPTSNASSRRSSAATAWIPRRRPASASASPSPAS